MISRVAVTETFRQFPNGPQKPAIGPVLPRLAAALVLLAVPSAALIAQEPEQWPQDDDYPPQQPAYGQPQGQQPGYGQQPYGYGQSNPQQGYYGQQPGPMPAQGMNAQQLEQVVAPIALYPDALVAQILAASTYPAQIAAADQWMRSLGGAPPDQIAAGANSQPWDPSVKALTAYPQVLSMLNQNLQWTTALGNAYYNQPQDVMETIQVLRQRAQSAGNLQTTPQEQVANDQGYISVAPTNPEVVYVPTYNPWAAYGQPIAAYPGYQPLDTVGAIVGTAVQFGLQFAVGAFFHFPFGFLGWGLDWFGHAVLFNHGVWCSHSASVRDWGFPHGGPRYFRGGGEWARYGRGGYGGNYGRGGYGGYGYGHEGYNRGGLNAYRNEPGFNRGSGQFPVARPGSTLNRSYSGYNGGAGHGFMGSGTHPASPQQYALNRNPSPVGTQTFRGNPQSYANRGQGYGYGSQAYGRSPQAYNYGHSAMGAGSYPRPMPGFGGGQSYRVPSQTYRAPTPSFSHSFSQPSGNAYAGNSGHSGGGFHPFGGGHSSPSYGGGHSFGGSGGGHGFGGGSHSFGGGGHSFGGGGHSGGGHSGGGGHGHHR